MKRPTNKYFHSQRRVPYNYAGGSVTMPCRAEALPSNISYQWLKDGRSIFPPLGTPPLLDYQHSLAQRSVTMRDILSD